MALSARTPSTLVTNYFIPTLYSTKVEVTAKSQLVCWEAINATWQTQLKKGNILNIPKSTLVSATEVVVGTVATGVNPMNTTGVQLTVDQWYEALCKLDTMSLEQEGTDLEGVASAESAYAIAKQMDTSVGALFSALNGSSVKGTDGTALTDDLMEDLMETLQENDVPWDGSISCILDPSGVADMCKIDKFISNQYAQTGVLKNGKVGNSPIYGWTVRATNNLTAATTGNYCAVLHKRAIGGAAQINKSWRKDFPELHQIYMSAEALWGVVEVMDAFGIPFYSRKS